MRIRRATVEDARAIAVVHVHAWQVGYRSIVPDEVLAGMSVERREVAWRESLERHDAEVWVAEEKNENANENMLGWVCLGKSRDEDAGPTTAELWALYVDPTAWRRGVGRALWTEALAYLTPLPFTSITLWVLDANARAIAFYRALGFAEDVGASSAKMVERAGVPLKHVRLRRALKESLP